MALSSFWVAIIALTTLLHRFAIVAYGALAVIVILMLVELMRPQLQLRKPLPKPEIKLNIKGPTD